MDDYFHLRYAFQNTILCKNTYSSWMTSSIDILFSTARMNFLKFPQCDVLIVIAQPGFYKTNYTKILKLNISHAFFQKCSWHFRFICFKHMIHIKLLEVNWYSIKIMHTYKTHISILLSFVWKLYITWVHKQYTDTR